MLIAQITDIHLGFDPGNPSEMNTKRFMRVLNALTALNPRPDMLILSGDLTDRGSVDCYERLRDAIAPLPFPVHLCLGNHDQRDTFARIFPAAPQTDGFVQYTVEGWPLRIVVADTLEEGRHGGAFCERRAAWLEATLAEQPDRPTFLVFHHPPIDSGLGWMTTGPGEAWAERLTKVVLRHSQVVAATTGHIHRACVAPWAGTTLIICPSSAPQVALNLEPIDPEAPDNRALILAAPASFALHRYTEHGLITHFQTVQEHSVLARFDETLQPLIRHLDHEHHSP
jgi:3',5'-cyclic-AMP phosphodiesterase